MTQISTKFRRQRGFSLAEVLASVVIGAMVLVTMITIYRRAETSAAAVTRRLDRYHLPFEILQRIAEDLDRIIASDSGTQIRIENKFVKGYPAARLTIVRTFTSSQGRPKDFERIVWQSAYDYDSDANGLVLFRSHSGISLEDKLLDEKRIDLEKLYPLVPICNGLTCFSIQVPKGEELLDRWAGSSLPPGIVVTISFAEPFETTSGILDVLEEEKITRTIAIDRTRKMKFVFVEKEPEEASEEETPTEDPNKVADGKDNDKDKKESGDEKPKIRQPR